MTLTVAQAERDLPAHHCPVTVIPFQRIPYFLSTPIIRRV